jgi:hypothetical protein
VFVFACAVHTVIVQDAGGIPLQFPLKEDTHFCQILRESLDFFGFEESKHKEFFLVYHKTRKSFIRIICSG